MGVELEPELSAHTHTLRQTAAARVPPPCLTAETPALLPAQLQHQQPTPTPTPSVAKGNAPAPQEVLPSKKGKTSPPPSVGLLGKQKRETAFSAGPEKEGRRIQTM